MTTHYRLDGQSVVKEAVDRVSVTDETVTYLTGARGPENRRVTSRTGTGQTSTRWHALWLRL